MPPMTQPEVSVDSVLAELAAAKAKDAGVTLQELIERWLREYVANERG